jgi:hypothetical protein
MRMRRNESGEETAVRRLTLPAAGAHLAVLWSFAFAKPLFDVLADSPEFFVARGNTPGDVVLFALAVTLIPPAVLLAVELALVRLPVVRRVVHLVFVGALSAAIAVQVAKDALSADGLLVPAVSAVLGAAFAFAYERAFLVRAALGVLTPLPIIFLAVFLFISPVSDIVFPAQARASAVRADGRATTPILLVVFDEFSGESLMDRRHLVDRTRYPNFSRLAGDATWYRNATTVADYTSEAVPAILTGRRPRKGQLPTATDHPDNLFSSLRGRYSFNVEEPVTHLCPEDLCSEGGREPAARRLWDLTSDLSIVTLHRLAPKRLERRLPPVDETFSGFGGGSAQGDASNGVLDDRTRSFNRFLGRVGRGSRKPTLDVLHIEFPHLPWQYFPSGQRYTSSFVGTPGLPTNIWTSDVRLVRQAQRRYLLQVGYADRLLGRLLRRARSTGLYDRALVIVTADHGVAFRPAVHRRAIGLKTFPEIAGVPLFIKAPGQSRGRVSDAPAISTDIFPTIASYARMTLPGSDGVSLRTTPEPTRSVVSVYEKYGDPVVLPFARFTKRRDQALAALGTTFGESDGGSGLFAPARYSSLVGTPIARYARGRALQASVTLDTPSAFRDIDAPSYYLPAMVAGRVSGAVPSGQPLALAVNGRVAAVTEVQKTDGELRFDAILDASPFRSGRNDFEALAIERSGSSVALAALQNPSQDVRLADSHGHETIAGVLPQPLPVGAGGGYVELMKRGPAGVTVSGWAASRTTAASRVLIFAGRSLVGDVEPSVDRPDVAKGRSPRTLRSGFSIEAVLPPDAKDDDIRAFAVIGQEAFELPGP